MKRPTMKLFAVLSLAISGVAISSTSFAQDEYPLVRGDYWQISGIDIDGGADLKYQNWLATEWKRRLEFQKSRGELKDYMVFRNVHRRAGEPDIYLVRVFEELPVGDKERESQQAYREQYSQNLADTMAENSDRAEYRTVTGLMLLQALKFRE